MQSAQWGREHADEIGALLGFRRSTPCHASIHNVLKGVNLVAFESALSSWMSQFLPVGKRKSCSIDGEKLAVSMASCSLVSISWPCLRINWVYPLRKSALSIRKANSLLPVIYSIVSTYVVLFLLATPSTASAMYARKSSKNGALLRSGQG